MRVRGGDLRGRVGGHASEGAHVSVCVGVTCEGQGAYVMEGGGVICEGRGAYVMEGGAHMRGQWVQIGIAVLKREGVCVGCVWGGDVSIVVVGGV